MRALTGVLAAGAIALGAAGCGESPQVTVYRQGEYQGKPDTRPWENPAFNNDRAAWERAIQARAGGQNEYTRIMASAR